MPWAQFKRPYPCIPLAHGKCVHSQPGDKPWILQSQVVHAHPHSEVVLTHPMIYLNKYSLKTKIDEISDQKDCSLSTAMTTTMRCPEICIPEMNINQICPGAWESRRQSCQGYQPATVQAHLQVLHLPLHTPNHSIQSAGDEIDSFIVKLKQAQVHCLCTNHTGYMHNTCSCT